jgi:hypothetical protein
MIWRLTEEVWWGNAGALAELPPEVRCVLAVGGSLENLPLSQTPLNVPEKVPYLRIAWPDSEEPPPNYAEALNDAFALISHSNLTPVLVHCRAGQMRSPAVAVILAHYLTRQPIAELVAAATQLRPGIMRDGEGRLMPYCRWILDRWGALPV